MLTLTLLAWGRSHWAEDGFGVTHGRSGFGISYSQGKVRLGYWTLTGTETTLETRIRWWSKEVSESIDSGTVAGFGFRDSSLLYKTQLLRQELYIPVWFIVVLVSIPLAIEFRSSLKRRRRRIKGLCATCGYDLRSSKDRCPECGVQISVLSPE
jgi:hypothetical protein